MEKSGRVFLYYYNGCLMLIVMRLCLQVNLFCPLSPGKVNSFLLKFLMQDIVMEYFVVLHCYFHKKSVYLHTIVS